MKKIFIPLLIAIVYCFCACDKYLDKVPNKKLAVPKTLVDLQALLDDYQSTMLTLHLGEVSADDYYIVDSDWNALVDEGMRRMYVWENDYLFSSSANPWRHSYRVVYWSNIVLDNIKRIERNEVNKKVWDDLKGQALFMRAKTFLDIALIWAPTYNNKTADQELGIPLRLSSDFNIASERASLKDTYQQIIIDFEEAALLLNDMPVHKVRPSKAAAYGFLARTYLFMRKYKDCLFYANLCFQRNSDLMNYNELDPAAAYPIKEFNKEVIFASYQGVPQPLNISRAKIDSNLYTSYAVNDLRKAIFFKNNPDRTVGFKGSYFGGLDLFSGLSSNELFLLLAECYVRQGDVGKGMGYLNDLLKTRWKSANGKSLFVPIKLVSKEDALSVVLDERRKELLMRGIRWPDIKRLNIEGRSIGIKRNINGGIYELLPNDLRFSLPIPEDIIEMTSMPKNPR